MKIKIITIPIQKNFEIEDETINNYKLIGITSDCENFYYHYAHSPEKIIKYYVDIYYHSEHLLGNKLYENAGGKIVFVIYDQKGVAIYYNTVDKQGREVKTIQNLVLEKANEYMQTNNLPLFSKPNGVRKRHYIYDYE